MVVKVSDNGRTPIAVLVIGFAIFFIFFGARLDSPDPDMTIPGTGGNEMV